MKKTAITLLHLFLALLAACSTARPNPPQPEIPTETATPQVTATIAPSPSPTDTPTTTPSPTYTALPTNTPTPSATPTPAPEGGGFIRYYGYNLHENRYYCGVMTVEGTILDQRLIKSYDDEDKMAPPFYCPSDNQFQGLPRWSPDGQRYIYYYHLQGRPLNELYSGVSYSNQVVLLDTFDEDISNGIYSPHMEWLGNNRIFYFLTATRKLKVIDLDTRKETSFGPIPLFNDQYTPAVSPSPRGDLLAVQFWAAPDQSSFVLLEVDDRGQVHQTSEAQPPPRINFSFRYIPVWSPDGSQFVTAGEKGDAIVFVVYDSRGAELATLEGGDQRLYGFPPVWSPDGETLLIECSPASRGESIQYDGCLFNLEGEIEQIYPYRRHWTIHRWAQFSSNGRFLYYLLKSREEAYPAQLYRLNLQDGSDDLIADGLMDYEWISTHEIVEYYVFRGIQWSPDSRWMILNDSGPTEKLVPDRRETYSTSVLCDPANSCQEMKVGSLAVLGAEWWHPPAEWRYPAGSIEKISFDGGSPVFEDQFSSLDKPNWELSGESSLASSEYGTALQLDGGPPAASITGRNPVANGDEIRVEFWFDPAAQFQCGLYDQSGRDHLILESYEINNYPLWRFDFLTGAGDLFENLGLRTSSRWYTLHLRVGKADQVQGLVVDKAYNQTLGGFNFRLEGMQPDSLWRFGCKINSGKLQIRQISEIGRQP